MLFTDNRKSERIYIRISSNEKEKLKKFAESEGVTISSFILKCIDYYIKNISN